MDVPIKFPELYEDPFRKGKPIFYDTFREADSKGKYVTFGGTIPVSLSSNCLYVGFEVIPLAKILDTGLLGDGVFINYLNKFNVPVLSSFLKTGVLANKGKAYSLFLEGLNKTIQTAKNKYEPYKWGQFQEIAPLDTCVECGNSGGVLGSFSRVVSLAHIVFHRDRSAVLCKKHSTEEGLKNLFLTGFLGWFGFGLFSLPFAQIVNARSLFRHSSLSKGAVAVCVIVSFLPCTLLGVTVFLVQKGYLKV